MDPAAAEPSDDDVGSIIGSHAGTLDLTGVIEANANNTQTGNHSDSSRRYGGPMVHQYAFPIVTCLVVIPLLLATVILSAMSLQRSNDALAVATSIESEMLALDYARPDGVAEQAVTEESIILTLSPTLNPTFNPTSRPPTPKPTASSSSPTSKPTTASPTTSAPTDPHPLNPQWFQTTHADWQYLNSTVPDTSHDWHIANMLCSKTSNKVNLILCDYEIYCPNGKGSEPYRGGPPNIHNAASLKETQWAPYWDPSPNKEPQTRDWAQIGRMSAEDGGNDENGFVACWKYEDWYGGNGVDIVDVWGEEHRMWIMCCEQVPKGVVVADENVVEDSDLTV